MDRLRRQRDLDRVFQSGRRLQAPWFVLLSRRRRQDESPDSGPRLAVVAGRKSGNAVHRNRAKRLLRETCHAALGANGGGWDIILIARPSLLSTSFAERLPVMAALLQEAGVLERQEKSSADSDSAD